MKTKLVVLMLFLSFGFSNSLWAEKRIVDYSIESAGSGSYGTFLVKVMVNSNKSSVDDADILYGAVHGVIFRGFGGAQGLPSQRPMADASKEQEKAEYFEKFFGKEATYKKYANIVEGSYIRIKVKRGYKVGATIQVNKENLRRELEGAGIIQKLSSGF